MTGSDGFAPPWPLRSPHVQTALCALPVPRGPAGVAAQDLVVPVPGDRAAVLARVWWRPPAEGARPAALVVHGVGGSGESPYAVRAARALYQAGFHAARLNLRGAGAGSALADRLYHAGLTADPAQAAAALARDARVARVALVGISLGGHVLLRLAAEWGGDAPAHAAAVVSISAPLDLAVASRAFERLAVAPYRAHVMRGLRATARGLAAHRPGALPAPLDAIDAARTVREFDDLVIAPMHGFAGAGDYYARASAGLLLARVRVPTLILHAADDPMVPRAAVLPFLPAAHPAVRHLVASHGGHAAFVARPTPAGLVRTWALARAIAFLRETA